MIIYLLIGLLVQELIFMERMTLFRTDYLDMFRIPLMYRWSIDAVKYIAGVIVGFVGGIIINVALWPVSIVMEYFYVYAHWDERF